MNRITDRMTDLLTQLKTLPSINFFGRIHGGIHRSALNLVANCNVYCPREVVPHVH